MEVLQGTVAGCVEFRGVGLHSGAEVRVEIIPATADTGIVFKRADLDHPVAIPARAVNVRPSALCTTIGVGDQTIRTVEHLLAALAGMQIDNARVRVHGPEIPILDGSALPFVRGIKAQGIRRLDTPRRFFVVRRAFEVASGSRRMRVEPGTGLTIEAAIDFESKAIGKQRQVFVFGRQEFQRLCETRTFCHINQVEQMRAAGLAQGGSLENAVVVDDDSILNPEGLRQDDEFVGHKILDCLGDLLLMGAPLIGRVILERPGHALHAQFMNELLARQSEHLRLVGGLARDVDEPARANAPEPAMYASFA